MEETPYKISIYPGRWDSFKERFRNYIPCGIAMIIFVGFPVLGFGYINAFVFSTLGATTAILMLIGSQFPFYINGEVSIDSSKLIFYFNQKLFSYNWEEIELITFKTEQVLADSRPYIKGSVNLKNGDSLPISIQRYGFDTKKRVLFRDIILAIQSVPKAGSILAPDIKEFMTRNSDKLV